MGWLCVRFPTFQATRTTPGFPDLTMVDTDGEIIFAELKAENGVLSLAQSLWRERLLKSKARYFLWRPSDWPEIERILQRK